MTKGLVRPINIVLLAHTVGSEISDLYLGGALVLDVNGNMKVAAPSRVVDEIKEHHTSNNIALVNGIDGVVNVIGIVFG